MNSAKEKRKQPPRPSISAGEVLGALTRGLIVAPARAVFGLVRWSLRLSWQITVWSLALALRIVLIPWKITRWMFGYGTLPAFENIYQREAYLRIKRRYRRHFWRNLHAVVFGTAIASIALGVVYEFTVVGYWRIYPPAQTIFPIVSYMGIWLAIFAFHFFIVRAKDAEDEALEASLVRYRMDAPPVVRKQKEYEEIGEYNDDTDYSTRLSEQTDDGEQVWLPNAPRRQTKRS